MSGSNNDGVAFSGLPVATQANDADASLLLQGGVFKQVSPKAAAASYVPSGAALLAAGPGASRGLPVGAAVPAGEPMAALALHATLQLVPPAVPGALPLLAANVGTTQGTVAAGNDARFASAVQIDEEGNLNLGGEALTLGGGLLSLSVDGTGHVTLSAVGLTLSLTLGNTDPHVVGQLWNNGGTLSISAG